MMKDDSFLDLTLLGGVRREPPLALPWPVPPDLGGFIEFSTPGEWRAFVATLGLAAGIPEIETAKFRRAQMLYLWISPKFRELYRGLTMSGTV